MTAWLVIIAVALASYVFRAVPVWLGARWFDTRRIERAVAPAGTAALAALVAGSVRNGATVAGTTVPLAVAVIVAGLAAARGRSLLGVLGIGGAVYAAGVVLVTIAG